MRPYRPADRAGVRHVCCETGFAGAAVEPLFPDRDAFADFFTRYYTDWEPETSFVATVDGAVVGYVLGCVRPRRHALVQPLLLAAVTGPKVLWRLLTGRYGGAGRRFVGWFLTRSWRETPRSPRGAAHFHFNALPGHRNTGAMLALFKLFYRRLQESGVGTVYGQIQTGDGGGESRRSERLFARWGFHPYDRRRVTKFDHLRGEGDAGPGEEVYVTTLVHEVRPGDGGEGLAVPRRRRRKAS